MPKLAQPSSDSSRQPDSLDVNNQCLSNWDTWTAVWFAAINAVTFLAFGFDKWHAGRARQRVSELSLVTLGALGGWGGGLIGMNVFRHKTRKLTFKCKYALTLIPFAAEIWVWWHWR